MESIGEVNPLQKDEEKRTAGEFNMRVNTHDYWSFQSVFYTFAEIF